MKRSTLLEIDGVGNVALGLPLLLAPRAVTEFLGLPPGGTFYALILGAVFVGIGAALLLERFRPGLSGLGVGGAVAIHSVFGAVLRVWLPFGGTALPARGFLVL